MTHPRIHLLAAAAAAVAGAVLAPAALAQAAPTQLAQEQAPTRVAAWEGTVMWSRLDPSSGTYALLRSVDGGAAAPVGVPPRGAPFDIDLGTSRSGRTVAVYTRDGDVYRLDVATGRETKVEPLATYKQERDPTIMRGQIAFIRRNGGRDELRVTGPGTTTKLLVRRRAILSAELGVRHVAYVESVPADFRELHVRVRNVRTGADQRVYRATSGGANAAGVTRPTYVAEPEAFVWARTNLGSGRGNRLVRYTLRGSKLAYAQGSPFFDATAWAGDALGVATSSSLDGGDSAGACADSNVSYCTVQVTGPLEFDAGP